MNFRSRMTFISQSVYSLAFAVAPGQSFVWGKLPPPTTSSSQHRQVRGVYKTLFSTGLQTPSRNCNMLTRQGSPLQSHALSQQDTFIQGQQTHSLVAFVRIPSVASSQLLENKHVCMHRCAYSFFKLKDNFLNHPFSLGLYFSCQTYNICSGSRNLKVIQKTLAKFKYMQEQRI